VYKRESSLVLEPSLQYGEEYFRPSVPGRPAYDRRRWRRIQKSTQQVRDLLEHASPGALLDIGCSVGYTLEAARRLGLDATGVDVSAFAVEACRARGFRAEIGALERLPFPDASFALIVMKHVLEHVVDARAALAEVRRVLRPGGGVFIAVPHAGYRKATRDPQQSSFFRPDAAGRNHEVYYTPATLGRLLASCGFRVARTRPHLLHRRSGMGVTLLDLALLPARGGVEMLRDALALRKEFWCVAVR
jgi:SAM-dependent methyltransferase